MSRSSCSSRWADFPVARFLEKNPDGGIHHLCYEVDDILLARDRLIASGARRPPTARRRSARTASRCFSCTRRISTAPWSNWSRGSVGAPADDFLTALYWPASRKLVKAALFIVARPCARTVNLAPSWANVASSIATATPGMDGALARARDVSKSVANCAVNNPFRSSANGPDRLGGRGISGLQRRRSAEAQADSLWIAHVERDRD